jgi:hypothetical protein
VVTLAADTAHLHLAISSWWEILSQKSAMSAGFRQGWYMSAQLRAEFEPEAAKWQKNGSQSLEPPTLRHDGTSVSVAAVRQSPVRGCNPCSGSNRWQRYLVTVI